MLLMLKVIFLGSHRINVIFFIVLLFVDSKYYIFISISVPLKWDELNN